MTSRPGIPDPIEIAIAAIDSSNHDDPADFRGEPLAAAQGRIAESWVRRLGDQPSAALRLAARAHHLRRWELSRDDYPKGRAGYLRWRRDQKTRHARDLTTILEAAEVDAVTVERAGVIVAKVGLGADQEVDRFEDAVVLTFLETQLEELARRTDPDRMVDVLTTTLGKLSNTGLAAAIDLVPSLALADEVAAMVTAALDRMGDPIS